MSMTVNTAAAAAVEGEEDSAKNQVSSRNRKKLTDQELQTLPLPLRSKYLAYEDPPKHILEKQLATRKRVFERVQEEKLRNKLSTKEELEKSQHEKLIGQLKAAEARSRIRITRMRYDLNRTEEVNQLVASQPSAVMAVRLQALLPVKKDNFSLNDPLKKLSRDRVEKIMNDDLGLSTGRT